MWNSLRQRWNKRADPPAPSVPDGVIVYAIGDIHGRLDLLRGLMSAIRGDEAGGASVRRVLVLLGDYIDRGPDSAGVIDLILELELERESGLEVRALKGNHEDVLLAFLDDASAGAAWMQFGGADTLASYGVATPRLRTDSQGWEDVRRRLTEALPQPHRQFLMGLELSFEIGDYFFVHAGVRPNIALEHQSERDMLWIRQEFLDAAPTWSKVVVHGHTPVEAPVLSPRRISLDTGAYATGVLTCLRLAGAERKIIQVGLPGPEDRAAAS